MAKTRVSARGQITIPKEVRKDLGLRPGDEIEFVKQNGNFVLRKYFAENPFAKWRGYLKELAGRDSDSVVDEMRGR
jgi:AbrB family looped-hinge helix DNA binding protein